MAHVEFREASLLFIDDLGNRFVVRKEQLLGAVQAGSVHKLPLLKVPGQVKPILSDVLDNGKVVKRDVWDGRGKLVQAVVDVEIW